MLTKSCLLWELLLGLEHELLSLVPAQTHVWTWEEHPWAILPPCPTLEEISGWFLLGCYPLSFSATPT